MYSFKVLYKEELFLFISKDMTNIFILLLLISGSFCYLIAENATFSAPYDMPRLIPSNFHYNVTGNITTDINDCYGKIYITELGGFIDEINIHIESLGAIGGVYVAQGVGVKYPGRRVAEFVNSGTFSIPAVEITSEVYNYLISNNVTEISLIYEENLWTNMFRSATFISFKAIRFLIESSIIIICTLTLSKLSCRRREKVAIINLSISIFASVLFILSAIDQFGQDQLINSKVASSAYTFGGASVSMIVWLYTIIMIELLEKDDNLTTKVVRNKWLYIIIALILFAIEALFVFLGIAIDPNSSYTNLLQLIGVVIRSLALLSVGILYLVYTFKLNSYINKNHPDKDSKMRRKTKYTIQLSWILGIVSLIRAIWVFLVIFLLIDPTTYAIFFWMEMLITSTIQYCLVLGPFIHYYVLDRKQTSSTTSRTSTTKISSN